MVISKISTEPKSDIVFCVVTSCRHVVGSELSFALTPYPTPSPIIPWPLFFALSLLSVLLEQSIFRDYGRINFSFSDLILRVTSQKEQPVVFVCDLSKLLPRQEHTIRLTSIWTAASKYILAGKKENIIHQCLRNIFQK